MDSKKFDIQIPDDQAENIATVGQAISYIEEAKNNTHTPAYFIVCDCCIFKIMDSD
jgi:acyl carrier protein